MLGNLLGVTELGSTRAKIHTQVCQTSEPAQREKDLPKVILLNPSSSGSNLCAQFAIPCPHCGVPSNIVFLFRSTCLPKWTVDASSAKIALCLCCFLPQGLAQALPSVNNGL